MTDRLQSLLPCHRCDGFHKPGDEASCMRANLTNLCEAGAHAVEKGEYEALRFNLFNAHEEDFVRGYMAERHPRTPFTCQLLFPREAQENSHD